MAAALPRCWSIRATACTSSPRAGATCSGARAPRARRSATWVPCANRRCTARPGRVAGALVFSTPGATLPVRHERFPHAPGHAERRQLPACAAGLVLHPVPAGGGARHSGRAARRLLGRRHHRLPPAPGLRRRAMTGPTTASCCTRISSRRWCPAGWTRACAGATSDGFLDNMVVLAPDPEWVKHAAERQAARPQGLHPFRQRCAGAHHGMGPRHARGAAAVGRVRSVACQRTHARGSSALSRQEHRHKGMPPGKP
jgi:hypothetical protein